MNQRFAMNQFALCEATAAQVQINENLYAKSGRTLTRPKRQQRIPSAASTVDSSDAPNGATGITGDQSLGVDGGVPLDTVAHGAPNVGALSGQFSGAGSNGSGTMSAGASAHVIVPPSRVDPLLASTQHYVRVRLHTNHEVKHTTTVEILPKMLVSEIINYICGKRKMNPDEWSLIVADSQHVLPLDGAAEDISNTTELALVPKSSSKSKERRIPFRNIRSDDSAICGSVTDFWTLLGGFFFVSFHSSSRI